MSTDFKAVVTETQAALDGAPERARATFEVESRLLDGLCCEASSRDFRLEVDEPAELGGTDRGPNPVELVLAALGTCQEITYRLYADALGIPLNGVAVKLAGELDLRGFFAVDDAIRPGFQAITGSVEIDSPASAAELARLKDMVDRHCPVLDILRGATPVALQLTTAPSTAAEGVAAAD